jgi:hypothetical protein
MPSFMKLEMETMSLVINPTASDNAGKYLMEITLTDTIGAYNSYPFEVIVTDPK